VTNQTKIRDQLEPIEIITERPDHSDPYIHIYMCMCVLEHIHIFWGDIIKRDGRKWRP
jgi:hypothetical protein